MEDTFNGRLDEFVEKVKQTHPKFEGLQGEIKGLSDEERKRRAEEFYKANCASLNPSLTFAMFVIFMAFAPYGTNRMQDKE